MAADQAVEAQPGEVVAGLGSWCTRCRAGRHHGAQALVGDAAGSRLGSRRWQPMSYASLTTVSMRMARPSETKLAQFHLPASVPPGIKIFEVLLDAGVLVAHVDGDAIGVPVDRGLEHAGGFVSARLRLKMTSTCSPTAQV